jgi:hypothetical protein
MSTPDRTNRARDQQSGRAHVTPAEPAAASDAWPPEPGPTDDLDVGRQHLALLLGRLLARQWLRTGPPPAT